MKFAQPTFNFNLLSWAMDLLDPNRLVHKTLNDMDTGSYQTGHVKQNEAVPGQILLVSSHLWLFQPVKHI